MVHLRLNDGDTSRNPYINFVSSMERYPNHAEALRLLHQLAAIYKPVMKRNGLHVNHLMEFEPNNEFAGRNWNAGENIEMVLRRRDEPTKFLPFGLICAVFAHELAHNKHMNHVPRLHGALTRQLTTEWKELQKAGYYGDGFWSGGKRLGDDAWTVGDSTAVGQGVFPGALCGGAKRKARTTGRKRKRNLRSTASTTTRHKKGQPSLHTGAQTAANTSRTAGKRRAVALPGEGSRIDGHNHLPKATAKDSSYKLDSNSTFRERATTNAARDLRAAAALKRINALNGDRDVKDSKVKVDPQTVRNERTIGEWMAAGPSKIGQEDQQFEGESSAYSSHTDDEDQGADDEQDSHTEEDSLTEEEELVPETPDDPQAKRQLGLEWEGILSQVKCGSGVGGPSKVPVHSIQRREDTDEDDDIVFLGASKASGSGKPPEERFKSESQTRD